MPRGGRRPKSTPAEREQVRSLAAQGASLRQIAVQVFGDRRYYGRVERILRRLPTREASVEPAGDRRERPEDEVSNTLAEHGEELTGTEMIRELVDRHWQRAHASGELPSVGELTALLRLEQRLRLREQFEGPQAISREYYGASRE